MIVLAHGRDGHRREHLVLYGRLAAGAGEACAIRPLSLRSILEREVVFLPMLEERPIGFALVALARAALRRRSVAMMFRPGEAVHSLKAKHRLKRLALRGLIRVGGIEVLTILPFSVDPQFAEIASGWIYDPQLWDWPPAHAFAPPPLIQAVLDAAHGRRIVVAMGGQNQEKGFDYFVSIWLQDPAIRETMLFVAAGPVAPASRASATAFAQGGGLLVDRFVEDDEMACLFDIAGLIWAGYSPAYNQASGIFGRAVQRGAPTVVRAGSYVEALAAGLDHPIIALPWDDPPAAARRLAAPPPRRCRLEVAQLVTDMRTQSVERLSTALGLALNSADGTL
jgi:hypothetical protein